jgi:hypothetical protein
VIRAQKNFPRAARRSRDATQLTTRAKRPRAYRAYQHLEARWGTAGEGCPRLKQEDAVVYTFGLFAGLNALLHDKASDNAVGVSADIPSRVARAADCLDNDALWHVPGALQAAAWASVPGSRVMIRMEVASEADGKQDRCGSRTPLNRSPATRATIPRRRVAGRRSPRRPDQIPTGALRERREIVSLHESNP